MNEGEILVYFLFPNFPDDRADRIYVVMDKAACLQFVESLHQCDRKLKEWRKIARRNNIELYSGDIGIEFPPFDIYWQKRRPAYGESTYFPCFMWAGIDNWFKPVGHISKDGHGTLEVNFLLPDFTMEEDYPVRIFIYSTTREYIFKFLDYETLKKTYWEVNRPAESYDHLFK